MRQLIRLTRRPSLEQMPLFDETEFSLKQATEMVYNYIEMFGKEKGIADIKSIKADDAELLKYLESFSIVRKACRTPENLRRIISNFLGK